MKKFTRKPPIKLTWIIFIFIVFLAGSLYTALNFGTGPLAFLASPSSINETKTLCTRKLDGRKDCTTYETSVDNGVKTSTTHTEIISDTGGVQKVVEKTYDVVKTTPVDNAGNQTGNSTTKEVKKAIKDDGEEEVVSTVVTVQKPVVLNAQGLPTSVGEVVSEVRTGDITLGVNPYKSGDLDKKKACEQDSGGKLTGKVWRDDSCQAPDDRTPEQKCTQDDKSQPTGNKWENNSCVMKIVPKEVPLASSVSVGVNCDMGTCGTSGSPVCYGTYASTGQYIKDANGDSTGEYDCRLCGDNGSGGVSFTGGPQSCKTLLAQKMPVVLGPDSNPAGLGLPEGTHTGSCLSKRGAEWVLTGVGQPGEGPNEGKTCDVTGAWTEPPIVVPPSSTPNTQKTLEVLCHIQHPGYIFGKNFDGDDACLPNTLQNQTMFANSDPCKPGKGELEGKEVWLECKLNGYIKSYTFCYGGTGVFDDQGNCMPKSSTDSLVPPAVNPTSNGVPQAPPVATGVQVAVGGATGCVVGGALGTVVPVIGNVIGCAVGGAIGGYVGNSTGNVLYNVTRDVPQAPPVATGVQVAVGGATGCVVGGALGTVVPVIGNVIGCAVGGAIGGYVGNSTGNVLYNLNHPEQP